MKTKILLIILLVFSMQLFAENESNISLKPDLLILSDWGKLKLNDVVINPHGFLVKEKLNSI